MSDPSPSAPSLPPTVYRRRDDASFETLLEPPRPGDVTSTPVNSPALTPVRAPTRRFVVKTVISPDAQVEKALAEATARRTAEMDNAKTLIGYPAPVLVPPADMRSAEIESARTIIGYRALVPPPPNAHIGTFNGTPTPRIMGNVQTIIKPRGTGPLRMMDQAAIITDPMRDAAAQLPDTLPPNNGVQPARPPPPAVNPDASTLPPNNKVPPAKPAVEVAVNWPQQQRRRRMMLALIAIGVTAAGVAIGAVIKRSVTPTPAPAVVEIQEFPSIK